MKSKPYKLELYLATDGARWRLKRKGRIVAESGEAYDTISKLKRAVRQLASALFKDDVIEVVDNL